VAHLLLADGADVVLGRERAGADYFIPGAPVFCVVGSRSILYAIVQDVTGTKSADAPAKNGVAQELGMGALSAPLQHEYAEADRYLINTESMPEDQFRQATDPDGALWGRHFILYNLM